MLPVAGLVVGACGAVPLAIGSAAGLPSSVVATLAIGGLVASTGGLHEDGLADTADGFGGGASRERKLAIMRDSRIGSYGVLAIGLALLCRVAAVAALLDRSGLGAAATAILASAAVSRMLSLLPMLILPAARPDGLGHSVGRPAAQAAQMGLALAAVIGIALPAWAGLSLWHGVLACAVAALAALIVVSIARRHIGGHTGDVAGASQQASEIGFLLALLAFPG